jgi:hypothetical protein
MRELLRRALEATAGLWPKLLLIFAWIGQAAAILDNPTKQGGAFIQAQYQALMEQLATHLSTAAGQSIRSHPWEIETSACMLRNVAIRTEKAP